MQYHEFNAVETPAYVFHLDELQQRLRMIRNTLGNDIRLVYAMKANPFLTGEILPFVDALEVCSPGEERICEEVPVSGEKLVLSGVNKERADFSRIAERYRDTPVYTVESPAQMAMLENIAKEKQLTFRVLLRLSSGNQFGMDKETILQLIHDRNAYSSLDVRGLQLYGGTQKRGSQIRWELEMLGDLIERIRRELSFSVRELEYGPGLACSYFQNEPDADDEATLRELREWLTQLPFDGVVTLEMGRFIAAGCGYYATRIAEVKQSDDHIWCIVDGGIHHLNYYGQMMAMKVPHLLTKPAGDPISCAICGSLCTVADVLVREVTLPSPAPQDLLVFCRAGAYSVTEAMGLFLSRDLAAVYFCRSGKLEMIRKHEPTWRMNHGKTFENT